VLIEGGLCKFRSDCKGVQVLPSLNVGSLIDTMLLCVWSQNAYCMFETVAFSRSDARAPVVFMPTALSGGFARSYVASSSAATCVKLFKIYCQTGRKSRKRRRKRNRKLTLRVLLLDFNVPHRDQCMGSLCAECFQSHAKCGGIVLAPDFVASTVDQSSICAPVS
jgi:hypothetical protein